VCEPIVEGNYIESTGNQCNSDSKAVVSRLAVAKGGETPRDQPTWLWWTKLDTRQLFTARYMHTIVSYRSVSLIHVVITEHQ